ncbi:sugar phosphate isomerase/epimerase family protein [Evansella cellulosilytica]|uniref:Xylose isomerase domain-containing protein TIM barrel n=1 Tax=Evansella cellulosilytica (strain ATCC 21833 / DSM 2522 / FERM P-1141 / JCM 9156 / N-4) TaxID=649639 RepID=E6TVV4_EVAC2|nr:sugar phosphate isomerase/epimerase [Evansella cellulosilytica]ADU28663.1 Xylose isomerase domain-containing protein TIM barrel [Evansella cellulosilytica DSM 2522]
MKVGTFTVLYQDKSFEETLDKLKGMGVEAVEIGTGNYPGSNHCKPDDLLDKPERIGKFKKAISERGMIISGLSCQGNPLHPNKGISDENHKVWVNTVKLAKQMEVDTVNCFSGCPGDGPNATVPNWVTCAWPPEFAELRKWQWDEVVVPYWKEQSKFAQDHGIKIAIEMHPGFVVYNTETLLELRKRAGDNIGANIDPSHLIWQGMDPVEIIKVLGDNDAIYHFHAKDTYIDERNKAINGVLDTKNYGDFLNRSWSFRTIGYGMSLQKWKTIFSVLQATGFDGVISIEHEDQLASRDEGLQRAIDTVKSAILKDKPDEMWWA